MAASVAGGSDTWTCSACTFSGNVGAYTCEICGGLKPGATLPTASRTGRKGEESKGGGGTLDGSEGALEELNERATAEIAEDIARRVPMIGRKENFDSMIAEFDRNAPFKSKVVDAGKTYTGVRRVRGDGNCFYRGYLFAVFERVLGHTAEITRLIKVFEDALLRMTIFGLDTIATEDPCNMITDMLRSLRDDPTASLAQIEGFFNDDNGSNYVVMFVRLMTSVHMQQNEGKFTAFLGGRTVLDYCKAEVEPMHKDSDQPQIVALANELGVPVRVEYLDSSPTALTGYAFPEGGVPQVFLIFRPGHYDVLYPIAAPPKFTGVVLWTPGAMTTSSTTTGTAAGAGARKEEKKEEKKAEEKSEEKKEGKEDGPSAAKKEDALASIFGI